MALSRSVGNLGVLEIAAAAILVLLAGDRKNIDIMNDWQFLFSEVRYSIQWYTVSRFRKLCE